MSFLWRLYSWLPKSCIVKALVRGSPMTQKAPGKAFREGISLPELFRMFPDDDTAQAWFEEQRWQGETYCPHCGSFNVNRNNHRSMPWRCAERECRKRFSVRVGTCLQGSHLGYQTWAIAIYLLVTSLKGVPSMKLHRDLKITQKTAWFLAHRIRQCFEEQGGNGFGGPVEVDESYFGSRKATSTRGTSSSSGAARSARRRSSGSRTGAPTRSRRPSWTTREGRR